MSVNIHTKEVREREKEDICNLKHTAVKGLAGSVDHTQARARLQSYFPREGTFARVLWAPPVIYHRGESFHCSDCFYPPLSSPPSLFVCFPYPTSPFPCDLLFKSNPLEHIAKKDWFVEKYSMLSSSM